MRIGIDASPLLRTRGGVGWHTYHLLRGLLALGEDLELVCYVQPGALRRYGDIVKEWESHSRVIWVEAGRLMRWWRGKLDRLDLYHGMNFKMRTVGRCGGIVTIHDVWLDRNPQFSSKLFGQHRSFLRTKRTAERAKQVITVSEHSAKDIAELYGIPRQKIIVIHNGVSELFRPVEDTAAWSALRHRLSIPTDRFILFSGGADPRKNHHILLRAYARRAPLLKPYSLVMLGEATHRFGDIRETARTFDIEDRVVCVGSLPLDELPVLYAHADLFVFPSLYEGFGMPVLEAMACGAPVITSTTTALPEVAGTAAVLVNPEDAEEVADAMMRVLEDETLREGLRQSGFQRAKQFTWDRAARQTVDVYRKVIEGA